MASYNKFNTFVLDLNSANFNMGSDTLRLLLTNTSPNAADVKVDTTVTPCQINSTSNAVELAAQTTDYVKKGPSVTLNSSSQSGGTYTLSCSQVVYTATADWGAAFRYAALYDDSTKTTATRPVIAWWDYGSSVTLKNGETFTVQFNSANPGTVYTLT